MKWIKIIGKIGLLFLSIIVLYGIGAFVCSYIAIGKITPKTAQYTTIYLQSNGVHADIILPIQAVNATFLEGISYTKQDRYFAMGWGDENFYINTPSWGDLTFRNACSALFLKSTTLIHLTRYTDVEKDWIPIVVTEKQLQAITDYIQSSFQLDAAHQKNLLPNKGKHPRNYIIVVLGQNL